MTALFWQQATKRHRLFARPMALVVILSVGILDLPDTILAQTDATDDDNTLDEWRRQRTVLDRSLLTSPRAKAMGGALSGVAEGPDALYHNPAGIGGLGFRSSYPLVRHFHFPAIGASANNEFAAIQNDFSDKAADETAKRSIINAYSNQRFYSRLSVFPSVGLGRSIVGYVADQQIAAVPVGGDSEMVSLRFRDISGHSAGFSMKDRDNRLFIGISYFSLKRRDVQGEVAFRDVELPDERKRLFQNLGQNYSGSGYHAGLLWRLQHDLNPAISLVFRDLGHTTYHSKQPDAYDDLRERQDMVVGFTISPELSTWGRLNLTFQANGLEDYQRSIEKKFGFGGELLLFGQDPRALLALRAGFNSAGVSYGAQLHLNLVSVQFADYAEDVGNLNHKVIDRRQEFMAVVDLAEY